MDVRIFEVVGCPLSGVFFAVALTIAILPKQAIAETTSLSDPPLIASPLTIVPPSFPVTGIVEPVKVKVDIAGVVTPEGKFTIANAVASDGSDTFVKAATESLEWWRFVPATDDSSCKPKAQNFLFSIWFEGTSEDPHVFLSLPRVRQEAESIRRFASIQTPTTRFPPNLLALDGEVQVLMAIDSNGDVTSANVLSSTPYGAFDSVVLASARRTHVIWKEGQGPSGDATLCMLRPYRFCSDSASGDVVSRPKGCRH